jgi:competence protein ComEC
LSAERNIIPYLKTAGISSIDILVINSLNVNEYKNLIFFVGNFEVRRILIPSYYRPLLDNNAQFNRTRIEYISASSIINKEGNFRMYIYYSGIGPSMMSEFVYGEQSFIFNDSYEITDDFVNTCFLPEENALMVLKASGSGSFNYNSADFIAKAEPEFVVISYSNRGRKKTESDIFARSLNETGYTTLKTGEEGAIIFETDGYETERVLWR